MDSSNVPKDPNDYAQWVIINIKNVGTANVKIKNLDVSWGKLHANDDKDKEVSKDVFEGRVITADETLRMNACGRKSSPSGTTGDFDLCDVDDGDRVIRHFYWDCPWGSSKNTWTVSGSNSKWMVEYSGANLDGGALGTITVDVMKKGN
ncbi:Ostreolysin A6 [Paramarasmius palmivorus]|uniref:Ostreolysin A6 n=1 Tax=Paramarasmius palmivorus TaxID=297713 RepID=A0AAW0BBF6_9AGAR